MPDYYYNQVMGAFEQLTLYPPAPTKAMFADLEEDEDDGEDNVDWVAEDVDM